MEETVMGQIRSTIRILKKTGMTAGELLQFIGWQDSEASAPSGSVARKANGNARHNAFLGTSPRELKWFRLDKNKPKASIQDVLAAKASGKWKLGEAMARVSKAG